MKKQTKNNLHKKSASLLQIFILVFGIVAISYAIGSEVKTVSAISKGDSCYKNCGPGLNIPADCNSLKGTCKFCVGKSCIKESNEKDYWTEGVELTK